MKAIDRLLARNVKPLGVDFPAKVYPSKKHPLNGGRCYHQSQNIKIFIRERDNYTCRICGEYGDQVDHIIPWGISHDSTISNLRTLCRKCNLATRRERCDARPSYDEWIEGIRRELATSSGLG